MTSLPSPWLGKRGDRKRSQITNPAELRGLANNFEERAKFRPVDYHYYRLTKYSLGKIDEERLLFARQKYGCILKLESIVSLCVLFNGYFCFINESEEYSNMNSTVILLIIQSFLTLLSAVLKIFRIALGYEIRRIKTNIESMIVPTKKHLLALALKVLAFLVHPNLLFLHKKAFEEVYLNTNNKWSKVQHNINDYLFLFQITCHMLNFVTWRLRESKFSGIDVKQMSQMPDLVHTYRFIIQSELRESPFLSMTKIYVFCVLLFTFVILITERPMIYAQDAPQYNRDFLDLAMSFKYASTVLLGTGEMVAGTILGKILTMIMGLIMVVLIKITLEGYTTEFKFNKRQKAVLVINQRLKFFEIVRLSAANFIKSIWRMHKAAQKDKESKKFSPMEAEETSFLVLDFMLSRLAYEEALQIDGYSTYESALLALEAAIDELMKCIFPNRDATDDLSERHSVSSDSKYD